MRQSLKLLICVVGSLVLCRGASGIAPDATSDQYRAIAQRNAFGLKPPEQPAAGAIQAPQVPKLILTGITTILGDRRALLKLLPSAVKPGEQAKEQSLILTEGQRAGNIEVLKVDENAGSVKVNNSGTIMTLTFEKDGAKPPSTPAPAPAPAPLPVMNSPSPGGAPLSPATATNLYSVPGPGNMNTGRHTLPTRTPRLPVPGVTAAPAAGTVGAAPSAAGEALSPTGQGPLPAGQGPAPAPALAPPATQAPAAAQPQSDLTPEQQLLLLELEQQVNGNNQNNNQNYAPSSPGSATPALPGGAAFPSGNGSGMIPPGATSPGAGNPPNLLPLMPQ